MATRSVTLLGLLASLALLMAACGGEDTLSDREYFAALEDVNAAVEARADAVPQPSADDPETIPAFFDDFLLLFTGLRADLAALAPPAELAAAHDALVDAVALVIVEIERVREAGAEETLANVSAFFAGEGIAAFNRVCATLHQLAADRGIPFVFDDDCTDK